MPIRPIKGSLAQIFFITFRELAIVAVAFFAYMSTRKLFLSDSYDAILNARQIIALEKDLGFFWEPALQSWVIDNFKAAVIFLNWAYIISYSPVILLTGLVLFAFDRSGYYYYRNVVLASLSVAIVVFILFPTAPPKLIPTHFIDTMQVLGPSFYGGEEMNRYVNIYAAMPSMHFSWGLIFGVICWRYRNKCIKSLGVIFVATILLAITITGNHYIVDAIAGSVITAAAFTVMELATRLRSSRLRNRERAD